MLFICCQWQRSPISNMWPLAFTVVLFVTIGFVHATVQNITIDSTNVTRIQYSGNWATSTPNDFDYGGTHEWSSDPSANAKFTFIGVGVYYMSSLFNHSVTTQIAIDGGPAKVLNLTNPAGNQSVASAVVWSANQLLDAPHTVVVSMAPGGTFVEVDAFIYSSDSNSTIPSQSPNPTGSSSSTTPTSISTISARISALRLEVLWRGWQ